MEGVGLFMDIQANLPEMFFFFSEAFSISFETWCNKSTSSERL